MSLHRLVHSRLSRIAHLAAHLNGLGWAVVELDGKHWTLHPGIQQGASACLLVSPASGLSVAVLANLEGMDLEPLAVRIAEILEGP